MDGKYFRKIVGKRCYLSPISMEDAYYYTEWLNDFAVSLNLDCFNQNITLEKEKETLLELSKGGYVFAIIEKERDKLLGNVGLHHVDFIHRRAEFGIFIGERNFWNRGYGTEATQLMLDFAFNVLNLHHVRLGAFTFNERAVKCYEKAGFKIIGRFTEYQQIGSERFDMILMEILAKDFQSPYIRKTLDVAKSQKAGLDLKLV